MYVFYPFFSKTFWAGVDDTEAKAEQKLHQYPTPIPKVLEGGKSIYCGDYFAWKGVETVLLEIQKTRQYEESRIESQRQE